MKHVDVEIAVCTFNGAESLQQTLDSFTQLVIPGACSLALIVVDNGSTDYTPNVLKRFDHLPLTMIHEPKQGLSICRNRAASAATGELLIWTDDDVVVSPTWLVNYVAACRRQPTCAFWGGPIEPHLPADAPEWIRENMETLKGCFAHRDLGSDPVALTAARLPYGANFAVRTALQKQFQYDETLGRIGTGVDGGEETELLFRMLAAGHQGTWVPDASLEHRVSSARLTEDWISAYYAGQGRAMVRADRAWSRKPWWLAIQRKYHQFLYRSARKSGPSSAWLGHLIRSSLAQGQIEALDKT